MNKPIYTTAQEAEDAFYDALARADLEAMMQVWSEDDEVSCIHPGGGRVCGLAAIRESWRELFASGAHLDIHLSQTVTVLTLTMAMHQHFEYVSLESDERVPPAIPVTNIFVLGPLGWRMVTHHASPPSEQGAPSADETPRVVH